MTGPQIETTVASRAQSIVEFCESTKQTAVTLAKGVNDINLDEEVQKSVHPETSVEAIANILHHMNRCEQALFDLSILKLEARKLVEQIPDNQPVWALAKKASRSLLNVAGEAYGAVRSRYDHIDKTLQGIRSINTTWRDVRKSGALPDPRQPEKPNHN